MSTPPVHVKGFEHEKNPIELNMKPLSRTHWHELSA